MSNEKGRQKLWVLVDDFTGLPLLLPTLYVLSRYANKSETTKNKTLLSLKYFYTFWEMKFGESFCYWCRRNNYQLDTPISELVNFFEFVCTKQHITSDFTKESRLHYLDATTTNNKIANSVHVNTVIKFLKYLCNEYVSTAHLGLSFTECATLQRFYMAKISDLSLSMKVIRGGNGRSKEVRHSVYKSMPSIMKKAVLAISVPTTTSFANPMNPWKSTFIQLRNDLILRLYFNYGLRRAELLLLTGDSFKMSAPTPSGNRHYILIITNVEETDDYVDPRSEHLGIKTLNSHRILSLAERDYLHLKGFYKIYRAKLFQSTCDTSSITIHDYLFTSSKSPYSPISGSTIRDIFDSVQKQMKIFFPVFYDSSEYEVPPRLSPSVARHTWAYELLAYTYEMEYNKAVDVAAHTGQVLNEKTIMDNAVDKLRELGGWSPVSKMPMRYARRFFSERANQNNLDRINRDLISINDYLETPKEEASDEFKQDQ
ncbi:site-specific integrase [Vibrio bivalvicida]|uniref:hypothetical protein n=1 Tax=Vibrio bivalvicida TaxID=1276888 RepID=UPI0012F7866D|nr:hypothetical protein [Vibrio bivalvicida]